MQDMSGAHAVAPDGSRLGIMPTTSGGVATLPRAPGHGRPLAASSGAARHDRPCATLRAPDQDVPWARPARAPGSDRPRAVAATAAAADGSHVLPPAAGPDSSHRGPAAGPPPTSVTDPTMPTHDLGGRTYTAEEVQQLTQADDAPVLAAAVRLLHTLIRRAKGLDIGRALDVLRRLLKDRPVLTPVSESAPIQSLDEAATYKDTPPRPADPYTEQGAPPSDRPPFKPP